MDISCADPRVRFTWPNGHVDWYYYNIYIDSQNIDGNSHEYHHTINHETGHALGLGDPICRNCTTVSNNFDTCLWQADDGLTRWVNSVMHSEYYCELVTPQRGPAPRDRDWPSPADLNSVYFISGQK